MNEAILQQLGLTNTQATAYVVLVSNSPCTPPALANLIQESRTNTYKILENLEQLGLVSKDETGKKIKYWANNPTTLVTIAENKKLEAEATVKKTDAALPELLETYYKHSIRPAVQFKNGRSGIEEVLDDYVNTGHNLYLIRSWKDRDYMQPGVMSILRKRPSTKGILTHLLAPDTHSASNKDLDDLYLFDKTWIDEEDYTAPVEWCAYGDKLAIISYGEEAVATVIKSKQVADGFKQLFKLLSAKQRGSKGYSELPKKARLQDDPIVAQSKAYKDVVAARATYIKKYGPHPATSD